MGTTENKSKLNESRGRFCHVGNIFPFNDLVIIIKTNALMLEIFTCLNEFSVEIIISYSVISVTELFF